MWLALVAAVAGSTRGHPHATIDSAALRPRGPLGGEFRRHPEVAAFVDGTRMAAKRTAIDSLMLNRPALVSESQPNAENDGGFKRTLHGYSRSTLPPRK